MTRIHAASLASLLGFALVLTAINRLEAQETQATQPASSSAQQLTASASPADTAQPAKPADPPNVDKTVLSSTSLKPVATTPLATKGKKKKDEPYTGPTDVIVLEPTPMLDEEGKQRQDPDGKFMWNPPVKQQRDKKGHPLFDAQSKPVFQTKDNLGYDENGKKLHAVKVKPPKLVTVSITRGTLTVDGLIGKAALNYEIKDLKYIYFYVPGIGTTVVSNGAFPGAVEQKNAFNDKTLTVTVGDHVFQLSSDNRLLGKNPESAFVLVDKNFSAPAKFPVMGYGPIRVAPYAWPGSKSNGELKGAVEAPPLPVDLRPTQLLQPCPTGQMRKAGPPVLPGQVAVPQPCVPIVSGDNTTSSNQSSSGNAQAKR
ncbi:MAG TPA: hypothetical protein VNU92_04080 [Edaphobacter sp.]|jgi:hypothetical protein|nr:hypothetical protein [Edaphobacter sp.]